MVSKIFRRKNGTYTLNEFEGEIQNDSVIPTKFSDSENYFKLRKKARIDFMKRNI